jgi:cytochrome P450
LEVRYDISIITMEVISHMLFSNSDQKTKQLFIQLKALFGIVNQAITNPFFIIPEYSILPTMNNRKIVNLKQEVDKTIKQIIEIRHTQARANKTSYGDDLLGLMLKNMDGEKVGNMIKCQLSIQDIFNECKAFFLGGFETTSTFIAWTMLLLAEYPEWQEHARKEILEVCGPNIEMDTSKLNQMKNVSPSF